MRKRAIPDHLAQEHLPVDEWALVESWYDRSKLPLIETLFSVGNGYLGFRGDHDEDWDSEDPGVVVNGFHETWNIHHAENAFGFATTGQTIVDAPDAKGIALYVDDEPLDLSNADLSSYERRLDLRTGLLTRKLLWRTSTGKVVAVETERLVSLSQRHVAAVRLRVVVEQGTSDNPVAAVVVASTIKNRQDRDFDRSQAAKEEGIGSAEPERDPRRHRSFNHHVLNAEVVEADTDGALTAGYVCTNSAMRLACVVRHRHQVDDGVAVEVTSEADSEELETTFAAELSAGTALTVTKFIAYHTSRYLAGERRPASVHELVDRCHRSLDRVESAGYDELCAAQARWLDDFWQRSDVELVPADGPELQRRADQQAMRWNLFALAQASAQVGDLGIAAKGVSGLGYEGHYFWDTEMYVAPFLSYTHPEAARQLLRFRWRMLPIARKRAGELNQRGALYPWRTINGEEASAYYAAGTAQYHINAAVTFALKRYVDASGDIEFLATDGAEILVETARLWADLGFYSVRNGSPGRSNNGSSRPFHIHGVTGPDEYTAVVNDNLYTNVMARFNLRYAARVLELLEQIDPQLLARVAAAVELGEAERGTWIEAAESMFLPYDRELGIHPQDVDFLSREPWDFDTTPDDKYPLLLNFHPLVIYRHQVLKQADVVLAMSLRGDQFSEAVRRRNFDYYDPITTGDSSLSACVQAMAAAQIGYGEQALRYFREALYVDLADLHGNTRDGVHVASAGGVWGTVAFGFAGLFETGRALSFDPQLPPHWRAITLRVERHGSRMLVELDAGGCVVSVLSGEPVPIHRAAGFTGLSPEPTGSGDATELDVAGPQAAGPDVETDLAGDDEVVLVEAGQTIYITRRQRRQDSPIADLVH